MSDSEQIDRIANSYQRELDRREKQHRNATEAIEAADTEELIGAIMQQHYLGAWGLVELLLDHGDELIRAEWARAMPDGAPEPPDEYFMAIALHLTPAYAMAIIRNAGDAGRALLINHADSELTEHYE
ncbi:MAG: hypothetical protein ACLFWB_08415 [Armatimonadota bacterium]